MTMISRAEKSLRRTGRTLAAILWLLTPAAAMGAEKIFFPQLSAFEGDMEFGLSREEYNNKTNGRGIGTEDSTATERLRLGTVGYVYHPRFITFRLKGAWGLRQEDFDSESVGHRRTSGTTEEYDLRAWLLPEHPYNLELYTVRRNPLLAGRLQPGSNIVSYEKGATFRYLWMPWSFETGVNQVNTSGNNTFAYDSHGVFAAGSAFLGPTTTSASYFRTVTEELSGVRENTRDRYYLSNRISQPLFTLNSRVEQQEEHRGGLTRMPATDDRLNWNEDITIPLPAHFLASAFYNVDRERTSMLFFPPDLPEQSFSRTETGRFTLNHILYASLRTNYSVQYLDIGSSTGNSDSVSQSVSTVYTKLIPGGRLTLGGLLNRGEQTRKGAPTTLREAHQIVAPGSFFLNGTQVNISTISVWIQDPPGSPVLLQPFQYQVNQAGPRTEIQILSLPVPFALGIPHQFLVDYQTIPADVALLNRQTGYNLRLELFNNTMNPYYNHSSNEQRVVSGRIPGGPDLTTSDTIGLQVLVAPFSLLAEYANYRSRTNPFESWRAGADYALQMTESASVTARLFHSRTAYADTIQGTKGYSDELTETSVQFRRDLPEQHLNLSAGGSYAVRYTFTTTQAYSANAIILWRLGKLEARAGATSTYSTSSLPHGQQRASSNYYYFTLTRHLF